MLLKIWARLCCCSGDLKRFLGVRGNEGLVGVFNYKKLITKTVLTFNSGENQCDQMWLSENHGLHALSQTQPDNYYGSDSTA
jgi:hypothetical protein